mgnify:CR=1 FL=1
MSERSSDPVRDLLFVVLALPFVGLAVSTLTGVGLLRGASVIGAMLGAGLLVFLPPLGPPAWAAARRVSVYSLLAAGWSMAVLVAVPFYFPQERAEALDQGMSALAGLVDQSVPEGLASTLDAWMPGSDGERPQVDLPLSVPLETPIVTPVVAEPPPPSAPPSADEVILPYEGSGSSLVVPVAFENDDDEVEVAMIFDTGATFTSVDTDTLRSLGVRVPADAPEVEVRTANGVRAMKLVLVDRVWLGGFAVEGVTVGVCDACAHGDEVGLLGLNVSGRFLVTVDQQSRELRLRPRERPDRTADVKYWVHPAARATAWPDGKIDVEVTLDNNSPRTVRDAVVRIGCDEGYEVPLPDVEAGETARSDVSLAEGADCEGYTVELLSARW